MSIQYSTFDYLKIKRNKDFKDIKDEDLVKQAQIDMDSYRNECFWSCPKCSKSVSYTDSLSCLNEKYIHEVRACNLNVKCDILTSCKKKMDLKNKNDVQFSSAAFDEIFARYQGRIVHESEKAKIIDAPEEIYGELCSSFSKIVGMFARSGDFSKTSERWFSSFFYKSIQNKISDIQKTKNYKKRSPLIKCEVCGEYIGKITSKHLMSNGHEMFVKKLYMDIGSQILFDSGEYYYYKENSEEVENRCMVLGAIYLAKKDRKEITEILRSKILSIYFKLYPNTQVKNNILSTNIPIDEDESVTLEDTNCESVTLVGETGMIDDIFMQETVDMLVDIFYERNEKNYYSINKMFKEEDISLIKRKAIIKEIIFDKIFYSSLKNSELDRSYFTYVKDGFTSKVLKTIKGDECCRMELSRSFKKNER